MQSRTIDETLREMPRLILNCPNTGRKAHIQLAQSQTPPISTWRSASGIKKQKGNPSAVTHIQSSQEVEIGNAARSHQSGSIPKYAEDI